MYDLIFFGIQGSGKGTQAALCQANNPDMFAYFSSGDIFRALQSNNNAIGTYLQDRINSGKLIADPITISMFTMYFHTVLDDDKYMLLDGYPRNQGQLDDLLSLSQKHNRKLLGVHFILDEKTATQRMLGRGRSDDTHESIAKRLDAFKHHTIPMINACREHFPVIDIQANQSVDIIAQEVQKAIYNTD